MQERVVATVRIEHHRIKAMPHLVRMPVNGPVACQKSPLRTSRGILIAFAVSLLLWALIATALGV
jgi:hypothetical protein